MATQIMTAQERLAHMQQAIDGGGVVLYKGRTIGNKAQLPTLSELAESAEEVTQALADLEVRKRQLALDEERLKSMASGQPLGAGDNVYTRGGAATSDKGGGGGDKTKPAANAPAK